MSTQARPATRSLVAPAIVGGILGGILIDAFLAVVMHTSPVNIWEYVASTLVGQIAFSSPAYAILGVAMHFAVSIVWALIYLAVAGSLDQLRNWIVNAIAWGVVVDAAMNLLLAIKIGQPFLPAFTQGLIAHIVFYALPVTWYIARSARR